MRRLVLKIVAIQNEFIEYIEFSPAEAEQIGRAAANLRWFENGGDHYTGLLMGLAGMFGVDEGNDEVRYRVVVREIIPAILELKDYSEIAKLVLQYRKNFSGSGRHRFYPLVVAVENMFNKRNVFTLDGLNVSREVRDYFKRLHPLYSTFQDLPAGIGLPKLTVNLPEKPKYTWLDVGSAPKIGGAPTLNILKTHFGDKLEITGLDISFPYYELKNGKIARAKQYESLISGYSNEVQVNEVRYLNGLHPDYNIQGETFLLGQKFDFISICMTIHHLRAAVAADFDGAIFRENNTPLDLAPEMGTENEYKNQIEAFYRLLERLEIGGIFFCNLSLKNLWHDDNFFIIQRLSKNKYKIYDEHPIWFRPRLDEQRLSHWLLYGRINVFAKVHTNNADEYKGLLELLGLTEQNEIHEELRAGLTQLFHRADVLVNRFQSWDFNAWRQVHKIGYRLSRGGTNLVALFTEYLEGIPEEYKKYKETLLQEVAELYQRIIGQ